MLITASIEASSDVSDPGSRFADNNPPVGSPTPRERLSEDPRFLGSGTCRAKNVASVLSTNILVCSKYAAGSTWTRIGVTLQLAPPSGTRNGWFPGLGKTEALIAQMGTLATVSVALA